MEAPEKLPSLRWRWTVAGAAGVTVALPVFLLSRLGELGCFATADMLVGTVFLVILMFLNAVVTTVLAVMLALKGRRDARSGIEGTKSIRQYLWTWALLCMLACVSTNVDPAAADSKPSATHVSSSCASKSQPSPDSGRGIAFGLLVLLSAGSTVKLLGDGWTEVRLAQLPKDGEEGQDCHRR